MAGVTFTTQNIRRYTSFDGYMVQLITDVKNAPYIEDFLAKQVNGELEVVIRKPDKKRSLNANAYLWVLCDEIAKAIGTDKEDVYKALIRRVGVFDYVLVKAQVADRFTENWNAKGLGWFTQEVLYKEKGVRQFMAYYGSSVYTKEELSRVLDEAVDEARNAGVKTLTKKELDDIKRKWKA